MPLSKQKKDALQLRMQQLNLHEEDIVEKFILGRGPGGQKINKTSSTVYLKHLPTQIEVKCSQERSQEINRYLARQILCEKIEKELFGIKTIKEKEIEKIKKRKKKKAQKLKRKLVEKCSNNI